MSQNYDDAKQPKSIRYHSPDWVEVMQMFMGINNADQGFDHFFLMCSNWMDFMGQMLQAVKQGVFKTSVQIDMEAVRRLYLIWEGTCYLSVQRDPNAPERVLKRTILYGGDRPEPKYCEEILKLPALQNLNPVTPIKDKSLLIRIREPVPIRLAFGGMDYKQVVLQGGYYWDYRDRRVPMFKSQNDIENSRAITMFVGRRYFHNVINMEKKAFKIHFDIVYVNFHRIISEQKLGFGTDDTIKRQTGAIEKVE